MAKKPTYEELEQRVKELEKEAFDRKKAKETLRESEKKYKHLSNELEAILDHLPALIFYKDKKGNFIRVNKYAADAHHMQKEKLENKSTFDLYAEDQAQTYLEDDLEVIESGEPKLFIEEPWETEEGKRWVSTSKIPFVDEHGDISGIIGISIDITDRKVADEALLESEEQYRTLIDNLPVAVYRNTPGPEGQFLMANPAFCKMFGFKNEEEVKKGTPASLYQNPEERKEYSDNLIQKGVIKNEERTLLKRDGTPVYTSITASVVYWKDGEVSHFDSIMLDITEQKVAEAGLRESEERYRSLFERSMDPIVTTSYKGKLIDFNQSALDLFGYTRDEIIKINFQELYVHPEDGYRLREEISKTGSFEGFETKLRKKDGSEVDCLFSTVVRLADDGSISGYQGIIRDITREKQTKEALRKAHNELEQRVKERTAALVSLNKLLKKEIGEHKQAEEALISAKDEIERREKEKGEMVSLLLESQESMAHTFHILEKIEKARDVKEASDIILDGIQPSLGTYKGAVFILGKDSSFHIVSVKGEVPKDLREGIPVSPGVLKDCPNGLCQKEKCALEREPFSTTRHAWKMVSGGDIIAYVIVWDLESRALDHVANYFRLNSPALHGVFIRDQLMQAKERAEKLCIEAETANRAKSDFLAGMSHELRTPLNAIIGFSQVLQAQYFGPLTDKQKEYIEDILGGGKHLLLLINDILDLSKVEAGKMGLDLSQVNIKGLLEDSLIMIKDKAYKHKIDLALRIPEDLLGLEITADRRKLKQIMFNLLSNAAKFTPDGGEIRVTAAWISDFGMRISDLSAGSVADLKEEERQSAIEISVADTGIGISLEHQKKIFEEFYQVQGGYTDKTPGTGLGLPLTRQLVEMHGGRIWIESDGEGKGCTFSFTLPIK